MYALNLAESTHPYQVADPSAGHILPTSALKIANHEASITNETTHGRTALG